MALILAVVSTVAAQQPTINANSVVNAASSIPMGLPNYGIALGGMFILKGQNLGNRGTTVANAFPLPTTMGATSMRITVGAVNVNVIMVYVVAGLTAAPDQLAGIVPSTTPIGAGTIAVTYNGRTSATVPITIVPSAFGIFAISQNGTGPGVFTDPNFKPNSLTAAAHAGDLLFIWGTGLGPITGSDAGAPPVGDLSAPVEVYFGNKRANVRYKGRSGCCAGIDQILIEVPAGLEGCYVSVVVKTGALVSNFTTVSIAPSGDICSDPAGFTTSEVQKVRGGGLMTIADLSLIRASVKFTVPIFGTIQGVVEGVAEGEFRRYQQPPGVFGSSRGSLAAAKGTPSAGCVVFPNTFTPAQEDLFDRPLAIDDSILTNGSDAGAALNFTGPRGAKRVERSGRAGDFEYYPDDLFGGGIPGLSLILPEYLVPGTYTVDNGGGGPDVGPFSATLTVPSNPIVWTNQDAVGSVPRSQDLTITWSGGDPGFVVIIGSSSNGVAAGAKFVCSERASVGSFTVPAWVLSALPVTGPAAGDPAGFGFLSVGATAGPTRFSASGIDAGYFSASQVHVKNLNFQ